MSVRTLGGAICHGLPPLEEAAEGGEPGSNHAPGGKGRPPRGRQRDRPDFSAIYAASSGPSKLRVPVIASIAPRGIGIFRMPSLLL
jgi:hypothetical protein